MGNILVAVHCVAYNQDQYIRECLDGFVMQKTSFSFVAIIHDDASTDETASIIREYEEKYPEIIKPIYETDNQWSKNDGSIEKIMDNAISATGAKYVAVCQGDDYWTDPLKLQKQVDFLEEHKDYSICFHNAQIYNQKTQFFEDDFVTDMHGTSTINDLVKGNYIHTPTVMYRRSDYVSKRFIMISPVLPDDFVLWMLYAEEGKIYKMPDCMSVYRMFGGGIWSGKETFFHDLNYLVACAKLASLIKDNDVKQILFSHVDVAKYSLFQINESREKKIYELRHIFIYRMIRPFYTFLKRGFRIF